MIMDLDGSHTHTNQTVRHRLCQACCVKTSSGSTGHWWEGGEEEGTCVISRSLSPLYKAHRLPLHHCFLISSVEQTSWHWLYPESVALRGRVLESRSPGVCPAGSGFESCSIVTYSPPVSSTRCLARFWGTATALTGLIFPQLWGTPALPRPPSMARPGRLAVLQVWPFHPKDTTPNLPPPATLRSATTTAAGESVYTSLHVQKNKRYIIYILKYK